MEQMKWSGAEKKAARQVFDAALQAELSEMLSEFRARAARAVTPEDMWLIADHLAVQRREIELKYDYRYSQLLFVFGRLVREKRIQEAELEALSEEKLLFIQRIASL
jgi:hypothetical protein